MLFEYSASFLSILKVAIRCYGDGDGSGYLTPMLSLVEQTFKRKYSVHDNLIFCISATTLPNITFIKTVERDLKESCLLFLTGYFIFACVS